MSVSLDGNIASEKLETESRKRNDGVGIVRHGIMVEYWTIQGSSYSSRIQYLFKIKI